MQSIFILVLLVNCLACVQASDTKSVNKPGRFGLISSTFNQIASLPSKIPYIGSIQQVIVPEPCEPVNQTSPSLQLLHNNLPPQFAQFATPENVQMLQGVAELAGLATAAATGNPIAIVKLVQFMASSESPVIPLVKLSKQFLPRLNTTQLASHVPSLGELNNVYENTVDNVQDGIHNAIGNVQNGLHNSYDGFQQLFGKNSKLGQNSSTVIAA